MDIKPTLLNSGTEFKMNFYKDIDFSQNVKSDAVDVFKKVRLFVRKLPRGSEDEEEKDKPELRWDVVCYPSVAIKSINVIEAMYKAERKKRWWYFLNSYRNFRPLIQQLNEVVAADSEEELWSRIFAMSSLLSKLKCNDKDLIDGIIEIVIEHRYLIEPLPVAYSRIIMFLANYDVTTERSIFFEFCEYFKWKILFGSGHLQNTVCKISLMAKFYAMVYSLEGDVNTLMDMIYDSLFYMKNASHAVILSILAVWPEIFPIYGSHDHLIVHTMAFVILNHSMEKNAETYLVDSLRQFLMEYYEYKHGEMTAEQMLEKIMDNISTSEFVIWLKSILLLCKRQGALWTSRIVLVNNIMPIIDLWLHDGYSAVPELLLYRCIHAIGSIFRNAHAINTFYKVDKVVKLFESILYSIHLPSCSVKNAILVQLWNLSTVDFCPCYELLSRWTSENCNKVPRVYFDDLRLHIRTMGRLLPSTKTFKRLINFVTFKTKNRGEISLLSIAQEECRLRQSVDQERKAVIAERSLTKKPIRKIKNSLKRKKLQKKTQKEKSSEV